MPTGVHCTVHVFMAAMRCYGNDNSCAVFVMTVGSKVCVHLYWQLDIGDWLWVKFDLLSQANSFTMRFPRWTLAKQLTKLVPQRAQKRFQTALPCDVHNFKNQKQSGLWSHVDRSSRKCFLNKIQYLIIVIKQTEQIYNLTCALQHTSPHMTNNNWKATWENVQHVQVPWLQVILKRHNRYYFNNQNHSLLDKVYLESTIWSKLNLIITPVLKLWTMSSRSISCVHSELLQNQCTLKQHSK